MKNPTQLLLMLGLTALGTGCFPEEDSCNVKTDGIYVEYELIQTSSAAEAKVTFWVGDSAGGTYLVLGDCGDELRVNGQRLAEADGNPVTYIGELDKAAEYAFEFSRADEGTYRSTVAAPAPMILEQAPKATQAVSRQEDILVRWEEAQSAADIILEVEGECLYDLAVTTNDDGSYIIEAGELEPWDDEEETTCDATLRLSRAVEGELDPDLKGTIRAESEATRSFRSTP